MTEDRFFHQAGSVATILYNTMLSEALLRVGKFPPRIRGQDFCSIQDHRKSQKLHVHTVVLKKKTECSHM